MSIHKITEFKIRVMAGLVKSNREGDARQLSRSLLSYYPKHSDWPIKVSGQLYWWELAHFLRDRRGWIRVRQAVNSLTAHKQLEAIEAANGFR